MPAHRMEMTARGSVKGYRFSQGKAGSRKVFLNQRQTVVAHSNVASSNGHKPPAPGPLQTITLFIGGDLKLGFPNSGNRDVKIAPARTIQVPPFDAPTHEPTLVPKETAPIISTVIPQDLSRELEAAQAEVARNTKEVRNMTRLLRLQEVEAARLQQAVDQAETAARTLRRDLLSAQVTLHQKDIELRSVYEKLSMSQGELVSVRGMLVEQTKELENVTEKLQATKAEVQKAFGTLQGDPTADPGLRAQKLGEAMAQTLLQLSRNCLVSAFEDFDEMQIVVEGNLAKKREKILGLQQAKLAGPTEVANS